MAGIGITAFTVTTDEEKLVSVECEATQVPDLQEKSSHAQWRCQELPRRWCVLAAGTDGCGLLSMAVPGSWLSF